MNTAMADSARGAALIGGGACSSVWRRQRRRAVLAQAMAQPAPSSSTVEKAHDGTDHSHDDSQ